MSGLRPLDRVAPGMELALEVCNAQGMRLLTAGTRLTAGHLRMLRAWGVAGLAIVGEDPPAGAAPAETDRQRRKALADELQGMFGAAVEDPRMAEILRVALRLRSGPPAPGGNRP